MNKARAKTAASLATKPFVLLCLTMFLGYANYWIITPLMALYVGHLGGSAFVAGLALLAFSAPSVLFRPFIGHIADRWSVVGVLACGLLLLAAGSAIFLLPYLAMVFFGAVVRGVAWAGFNTGGYTTLAITAPAERRGEAAGYYTSVTASASIAFPALGLWLIEGRGGYESVFLIAVLLALLALPVTLVLSRTKGAARAPTPPAEARVSIFDKGVLLATGLNLSSTLAVPSVMAFLPVYARSLGIDNIGVFYVIAGATSIVVRPLLGKKSDAIGRGPAIGLGLAAQFIGLLLILIARDLFLILIGGFFVALGIAMIGSTATALAMDLADPRSRGRAMATYSISFQIGAGVGAVIAGALADMVGLRGMYAGSLLITLAGFTLLACAWRLLPRPATGPR